MWKEFKEFAMKGNLLDIAVGFVMGAAFAKVISAFTGGIVSPLMGLIMGSKDLSDLKIVLQEAGPEGSGITEVAILWGSFITNVIDFLIIAFVMFMVVKGANKLKRKEEAAPAAPAAPAPEIVLLEQIRDLLKK